MHCLQILDWLWYLYLFVFVIFLIILAVEYFNGVDNGMSNTINGVVLPLIWLFLLLTIFWYLYVTEPFMRKYAYNDTPLFVCNYNACTQQYEYQRVDPFNC